MIDTRSTTPPSSATNDDPVRHTVLLLAPGLDAVSGVSTHARRLLACGLSRSFDLRHFRVGSEGRQESRRKRLQRLAGDLGRLIVETKRSRAAVIHVNTSMVPRAFWRDAFFVLVARLCRTRVVYQVHGGKMPQAFCRGNRFLKALLTAFLSLPARIVLLGRRELDAWRELVPAARLAVIPNAIETRRFDGAHPSAARTLGLLYLGRLGEGKGVDDLLHALASPELAAPRPRLTVVGSGPREEALRSLAHSLGLSGDVRFTGALSGEAKRAALEAADVFVLPSHDEGLPYALLEAMAAGNAVITTAVGAIPEVVTDGVHGLVVTPRDRTALGRAILKLRDDRPLRERMGTAARDHARSKYDVSRLEREFSDVYRSLAGTDGTAPFRQPMNSENG